MKKMAIVSPYLSIITLNINIIFYKNYKWSITFKIVNHYIVHL